MRIDRNRPAAKEALRYPLASPPRSRLRHIHTAAPGFPLPTGSDSLQHQMIGALRPSPASPALVGQDGKRKPGRDLLHCVGDWRLCLLSPARAMMPPPNIRPSACHASASRRPSGGWSPPPVIIPLPPQSSAAPRELGKQDAACFRRTIRGTQNDRYRFLFHR